jgi:hypothetical protein
LINDGLANTPEPILEVTGASKVLLGSVNVIVGSLAYPDPGSVILIWNILLTATLARALVVAPVLIYVATVPVPAPTPTNCPYRFLLPNVIAEKPDAAVLVARRVQVIPSGEVAAAVVVLTARNTPWPYVTSVHDAVAGSVLAAHVIPSKL